MTLSEKVFEILQPFVAPKNGSLHKLSFNDDQLTEIKTKIEALDNSCELDENQHELWRVERNNRNAEEKIKITLDHIIYPSGDKSLNLPFIVNQLRDILDLVKDAK